MTLEQWSKRFPDVHITDHKLGAKVVYHNFGPASRDWDIFHLTDWAVTTVSGPVFWLCPR